MFVKYNIHLEEFKDLLPNVYINKDLLIPCMDKSIPQKCIGFIHKLNFFIDYNNNYNCIITGDVIFFDNNKYTFIGFETREDGEICGLTFKEKEK